MTQQESNILVQNFIKTLVKVDSYPYAVGFMGSVLISLLSGRSTPEQEIEMITNYIIENGGTK